MLLFTLKRKLISVEFTRQRWMFMFKYSRIKAIVLWHWLNWRNNFLGKTCKQLNFNFKTVLTAVHLSTFLDHVINYVLSMCVRKILQIHHVFTANPFSNTTKIGVKCDHTKVFDIRNQSPISPTLQKHCLFSAIRSLARSRRVNCCDIFCTKLWINTQNHRQILLFHIDKISLWPDFFFLVSITHRSIEDKLSNRLVSLPSYVPRHVLSCLSGGCKFSAKANAMQTNRRRSIICFDIFKTFRSVFCRIHWKAGRNGCKSIDIKSEASAWRWSKSTSTPKKPAAYEQQQRAVKHHRPQRQLFGENFRAFGFVQHF